MAEVEAKFHLTDELAGKLTKLLTKPNVYDQADTYFDTPKGISLRIREETLIGSYYTQPERELHRKAFITIKTVSDHADGIRAVDELEPNIDPTTVDVWVRMFEQFMGFPRDITVKKRRFEYHILYKSQNAKLVIDQVEHLGYFCEVEILSPDVEAAKANLAEIIKAYGLDNLPPATGSYRYMLNNKLRSVA